MNDIQTNHYRMFGKVKGVFTANNTIVAKYAQIRKSFDVFDDLLNKIEGLASEGSSASTGTFVSKHELKEAMAVEAVELASAGFVYAKNTGTEMTAVLDVSFSEIRYADDQEARNLALALHSELSSIVPQLKT